MKARRLLAQPPATRDERGSVPLAPCETTEGDQSDQDDDQADPKAPHEYQDDPDDHDDAAERYACDSTPVIRSSQCLPSSASPSLPHHFSTPCELGQPWRPASTSHRLPAPGSCAQVLPETPRLYPMAAERPGRPGEHLRTDSQLQKTYCGRPSFRCERRSFDRSCVRSLAWLGPQASVSRVGGAHSRLGAETPRNLQPSQRSGAVRWLPTAEEDRALSSPDGSVAPGARSRRRGAVA
jgi:hypothetical protein